MYGVLGLVVSLSWTEMGGDPPCRAADVPEVWDSSLVARPDLSTRAHIHDLVVVFYREIMFDELLEPVFGEVAEVDWVEHSPKLIDYWTTILRGTRNCTAAVTATHRDLHSISPIEPEHCDRWDALWVQSVDGGWAGPNAVRAKRYAATLMAGLAKRVFGFPWAPPSDEAPSDLIRRAGDDDIAAASDERTNRASCVDAKRAKEPQ
jgi:hemoglobin